ncbi:putative trna wybutosine-synthesizing protein 1 protein [Phaeoacremonium minimum UCRPA7]|uniref:S-adenosyl-L-methionine-dependent tRNA 4-demethylwyosine synthase n=1 Tax=Phaeoacremonium minimum (strain UCR-PA7) TaxID=1286976 RepID=R8BQC3_PHAM7|nr:putative trna wybutosine-synthesizing protein 1 protein [Phaeoacremonium minimum UCRPA7]EOO01485.1 putative trna wybutosine-synthesizing protein 1 protein [Phaeoacremonium minimum UCRPA7]
MTVMCCASWGDWAIYMAWGFWWFDVVISLACAISLPFIVMHRHRPQLNETTAALLLPVVPAVVASASGGILAEALPNTDHAVTTLVTSYILWGIGESFSMFILAMYFHRLTVHHLPPREIIVSVFLPVGPLGQGGFGIQQLGKVALKLLPQTASFGKVGTDAIHGGEVLYMVGIFMAFIMWGAGLGWLMLAGASILTTANFPFNMGWWGFTFPLGVFTTCTGMLAQELSSPFFKVLTMIFSISVFLLCQLLALMTPSLQLILALTLTQPAVEIWHVYRIPILLATFAILVSVRVYLHFHDEGEKLPFLQKTFAHETKETVDVPVPNLSSVPRVDEKRTKPSGPRRIKGELQKQKNDDTGAVELSKRQIKIVVFFSSLTGSTKTFADKYTESLAKAVSTITCDSASTFAEPQLIDLSEVDFDDYFITPPKSDGSSDLATAYFYLFLIPSYNIDTINDTFLEHLQETHHDFRIDTAPLSGLLGYSVFGLGDREGWPTEEEGFGFQAKEVDRWMAKLSSRKRAYPLGLGDTKKDLSVRLQEWSEGVVDVLGLIARTGSLGEGVPGSGDPLESDGEDVADEDDGEVMMETSSNGKRAKTGDSGDLGDVEDLGRLLRDSPKDGRNKAAGAPLAVDFTAYGTSQKRRKQPVQQIKEMVPKGSPTYTALTKQGYSIVGSHSGVKICRWTKSALRGRGSCYKFSFYGINSHQCMETTPSLSCSNKCVFCWRHGTNPVGTNWRWVVDPPQLIFDGVRENHYKKIKMMRGVPGVRAARFAEAMRIRHCALSLVGEPIFYPHINEFLGMLHKERISSFLVCNAQHPDQLAALNHVTQLYVSIDASNKESLRKVDRPLHRDFWERFQRCLDILREKRFKQRTVFRLTLVKGFNIEDEVEGYADLIERSLPCFVEIKGVTYCGTSTSSSAGLSMANVPFYSEVCDFVTSLDKELNRRGLNYGIAAEHAHSCCVLLASDRFKVNGKWRTLIDYDKFFQLLEEKGQDGDFSPEDYMGQETPEWATWGNGGFDPRDQRVDRKGRPIEI